MDRVEAQEEYKSIQILIHYLLRVTQTAAFGLFVILNLALIHPCWQSG
jgi:hypothetical protein